ncbi:DUF5947 family protein [Streptomyces oceani]|uniref:Uncharacterized protein n=1 Tax=Streptomyces oceani TaxID=1075402 RepID=A0A1E7KH13_9ACTN|nr:DUF5947 family protein [Streptomyces oceani]OEV03215.1 hypothetical protein AN216_12810 [Streptomyces oceani]
MTAGALQRLVDQAGARRADSAEHCDLCSVPLDAQHRHMVDTARQELLCACLPCSLLFVRDAASEGHYQLVPRRRLRLAPVATEPLGVPVGLAFFVPRADGTALAHYPSPAGATRWEIDAATWQGVVDCRAELATLVPHAEALLVNTARGEQAHWILPVDDCFRLVAVVRREWRGISGGSRVWPEIERFFTELTEQS